jgi:hypothetical protein
VTQSLSVSPNRLAERFMEASEGDVSKYERALLKAVDTAVARACPSLGGRMTGGICEVNGGTK